MSTQAVSGVGTIFSYLLDNHWIPLSEIKNVSGPDISANIIEVTSINSPNGTSEFITSDIDSGNITLSMNFTYSAYSEFLSCLKGRYLRRYQISLPNAEKTTIEFDGLITNIPLNIKFDDIINVECTIKISSEIILGVKNNTKPVITRTGSASINHTLGQTYTDLGATAYDDVDGDITGDIVVTNPVNKDVAGTYTVRYNVFDSSYNHAVEVTRTVIVAQLLPSVTTVSIVDVSSHYVNITINVTAQGASNVTSVGVAWQLLSAPGGEGGNTENNYPPFTGEIVFTNIYIGRTSALYRFRAFAINSNGTAYGEWIEFTTGS